MPGEVETTGSRTSSPQRRETISPPWTAGVPEEWASPPTTLAAGPASLQGVGRAGLGWAGPPPHAQKHQFTAGQVLGSPEGPPCASDLAQRGRSWQPHRRSCSQMCLGLGDGALEHWQNWRLFCTPVVPVSHFYDTCHNPRCLHEQGTPGRVSLSFVNSVPSQVPDTP